MIKQRNHVMLVAERSNSNYRSTSVFLVHRLSTRIHQQLKTSRLYRTVRRCSSRQAVLSSLAINVGVGQLFERQPTIFCVRFSNGLRSLSCGSLRNDHWSEINDYDFFEMSKRPTAKKAMRCAQCDIRKGTRDVEREIASLKREKQKTISQIKQAAEEGNDARKQILAKSLNRLETQITKLTASTGQLKSVSTQITIASATHTVGVAMKKASSAMEAVRKAKDAKKAQQSFQALTSETERIDVAQEIVNETLESTLDPNGTISEKDESKTQVLDATETSSISTLDGPPSLSPINKQSTTERDHNFALGILFLAIIAVYIVVKYLAAV